ncbi:MAG: hydantoinase/oxoprolinase family protein [Anaerolineae bacterium]|nr:hydantoinase/oxoprolinase family protein [Anaerolineae bacterium]
MQLALGIDTGSTYTDAVIVDQITNQVIYTHKALTTHHNLAIGIEQAIAGVLSLPHLAPQDIVMVGLSTTLATNAIVEGQGSPICLILIGYDAEFMNSRAFDRDMVTEDIVFVSGGHNGEGDEIAPLDLVAVREAVLSRKDKVAAFAISGYFGVRNPAHELRVKDLVESLTRKDNGYAIPVTCGHELTTKLNAIRRATTVALNASLIPVLRELILTVRGTLNQNHITAPLMVVKGDGSLVRSEWAILRPIETILSGPAASVVGAWHLAGRNDMWVVDVGGTTTDIGVLREGQPRLNPQGARVGKWQTMVEAVDVHTVGLGGDSYVRPTTALRNNYQRLSIGPQRVLPLCRLGSQYPDIKDELQEQLKIKKRTLLPFVGRFLVKRRHPLAMLPESDAQLLEKLQKGPVSLVSLARNADFRLFLEERIERLIRQQLVLHAAFTPTDAQHVVGSFKAWDSQVSYLGASLMASALSLTPEDLCDLVTNEMSDRISSELVTKVLVDEGSPPDWHNEPAATAFLARALSLHPGSDLDCRFSLRRPVVAVGAPVRAYMPATAQQLHTELIIPEQADVANALGAVAGSVVQRATALVRPVDFGERYRLYLSGNLSAQVPSRDFDDLESCVTQAQALIPGYLIALAKAAGAGHVEIKYERRDLEVPVREHIGQTVFLETELAYTAVGRPASSTVSNHEG